MKRLYMALLACCATLGLQAQTYMKLWQGGNDTRYTIREMGDLTFQGSTLTIQGTTYNVTDIDSLIVVPEVNVVYNGTSATVSVPKSIRQNVTVATDGAHVTITNNNTSNEIEVNVSGRSDNGSLLYNGSYKCTLRLNGVALTNPGGAALNIQCGKRVALVLTPGTENTFVDGAGGTHKAALYCRGHLEVEGSGNLTVTGNTGHALASNEYLQLKRSTGTITIGGAVKDAIHCGQYFQMNGGNIVIDAKTLGDGIQSEQEMLDDGVTPKPEAENTGQLIVKGGSIQAVIAGTDNKGLKADKEILISGGTINIAAKGPGSRGIQTDADITISAADAETNITISAEGPVCNAPEHVSDPHRCVGIKTDATLTVQGGTVTLTATGKKARAVRALNYVVQGGTVNVDSSKIKTGQ